MPNKRFRLLGFSIIVTGNSSLASAGVLDIKLKDGVDDMGLQFSVFAPVVAVTSVFGADFNTGWVDLGEGILSNALNNALKINLSSALSTGKASICYIGREE
jgi:hypothetical protein